jgi:hypothetical protein
MAYDDSNNQTVFLKTFELSKKLSTTSVVVIKERKLSMLASLAQNLSLQNK